MNNGVISVVIPMYNSENTIERVLAAIENQERADLIRKIVVVNDGSKDNSVSRVEEFMKTCKVPIQLVDKPNGGVSSARNAGMQNAGDVQWIAFCDSDDLWFEDKLTRQMKILEQHPEIDFLGGAIDDRTLKIGFRKITKLYRARVKDICIKNFPQPSTVLMKKKIYDEMGGFDEKQKYAEDGNYFLKIAARYHFYYMPEQVVGYGFGKREFGASGLSANLKAMYKGNVKNLKELRALKYITLPFYLAMRAFFWLKYCRRIVITFLCNKKKG